MIGEKFGKWLIIARVHKQKHRIHFQVHCQCGKEYIRRLDQIMKRGGCLSCFKKSQSRVLFNNPHNLASKSV